MIHEYMDWRSLLNLESFGHESRAKRVYLDHASAPPILPEAIAAMREAETFVGNAGAIHAEGVAAKKSLEHSREQIASFMGCKAREIIFTSGLTESSNLAIVGYARSMEQMRQTLKGTHWLVSSIEHDSVLAGFAEVERLGGTVSYVEPNERGIISPLAVAKKLRAETVFVSIGWANNEIGTIQSLAKIAQTIRVHEKKHDQVIFHADGGQAPLYLPTLVHSLGVDLLSLGANKLYGPHGIGALYRGKDMHLSPIIVGGKQERGLRAGTENVALAAGFAAAYDVVAGERERESKRVRNLRDELAKALLQKIPGLVVNGSTPLDATRDKSPTTGGDLDEALPHMLNVSIPDISSEYITLALDTKGIAVSTKSACREGEESRSHVVAAMFPKSEDAWRAKNTLRFSLGRETTEADIGRVAGALVGTLRTLM